MRTNQFEAYAVICGLFALVITFAQPARGQQISSSSRLPATSAADAAPTAVSQDVAAHPSQNLDSTPVIALPDAPLGEKPIGRIGVERLPSRRSWIVLSITQHSAAVFDAYSTRQAIANGATEQNPLLRPFASSPAIYAATQVGPLVLDYAARRMQLSRNSAIRHMWWLPQSTGTAFSICSGVHNMRVADQTSK
jgi:hypothetical protein